MAMVIHPDPEQGLHGLVIVWRRDGKMYIPQGKCYQVVAFPGDDRSFFCPFHSFSSFLRSSVLSRCAVYRERLKKKMNINSLLLFHTEGNPKKAGRSHSTQL